MGDSHNPDDPHFAAFKQRTLDSYRVRRVEDLPVNYRGLLAVEGELLTSTLFKRYGDQAFAAMESQSRVMDAFALVSPTVALRRLSMAAAQTDLASYRRFVEQAEAYRFALVQRLNRLEADAVEAADDAAKDKDASAERRSRISASHWRDTPAFQASPFPSRAVVARALPALFALALWLGLVAVLAAWGAARLVRSA